MNFRSVQLPFSILIFSFEAYFDIECLSRVWDGTLNNQAHVHLL